MVEKSDLVAFVYTKLAEAPLLAHQRTQRTGIPFKYRRVYSRIVKHADEFYTRFKPPYTLSGESRPRQDTESKIIILPGLRGVGKTTVMLQLYQYLTLRWKIPQQRVLYFPADELTEYLGARISDVITVFVEDILQTSLVKLDEPIFILIDEAHYDDHWSATSKIVYDQTQKVFMALTGSSALSLEMGVDLARRADREIVFPLNFSEHLLLKYDVLPREGTAQSIRDVLFIPSDTSVSYAQDLWRELKLKMLQIGTPLEKEFEYYLSSGGFPFGIHAESGRAYKWIFGIVDKIVDKDLLTNESFKSETRDSITRIISFLVLKPPGEISHSKLAERLEISRKSVSKILDVLEKAHLIFSVKPYGEATKVTKKPWKYYFLSPSIPASIRFALGKYDPGDRQMLGAFAENLVASYFLRLKETRNELMGIFYDPRRECPDFLITRGTDEVIPVEVSIGEKEERQVKKAVREYHARHGVILSDTDEVIRKGNLVYLPLTFFSFV